jgi:hypothetical protein
MDNTNNALPVANSATAALQEQAICVSAAFNFPVRGKRLAVAFSAAVTYSDKPTG